MQCQICKKEQATIHLTEINDGVRNEVHVCENCAVDQGITVKSQMPINELLSSLLSSQPSDDEMLTASGQELACPDCGFTLDKFRKEAVLGCPNDYEIFSKALMPLIKKAHEGKSLHCGKVPSRAPKTVKKQVEISALQQQLNEAVKKEDYEKAAMLRDKINQKNEKNSK